MIAILKILGGRAEHQALELPEGTAVVFLMDEIHERARFELFFREAENFVPGGIDLLEVAIKPRNCKHVDRQREETISFGFGFQAVDCFGQFAAMLRFLKRVQLAGLITDLLAFFEQVHEYGHFGLEHLRHDGREHVIDGAE